MSSGATLEAAVPRGLLQDLLPSTAAAVLAVLGDEVAASATISPAGWSAVLGTELTPGVTTQERSLSLEVLANGSVGAIIDYEGEVRLLSTDAAAGAPPR